MGIFKNKLESLGLEDRDYMVKENRSKGNGMGKLKQEGRKAGIQKYRKWKEADSFNKKRNDGRIVEDIRRIALKENNEK